MTQYTTGKHGNFEPTDRKDVKLPTEKEVADSNKADKDAKAEDTAKPDDKSTDKSTDKDTTKASDKSKTDPKKD